MTSNETSSNRSRFYGQLVGFFLGLIVGELFFGEPGLGWVTGLAIGSIVDTSRWPPIALKAKK
ncbi:MAG: hypothetical protein COB37_00250 [Kordiimonadales bacterium]|nr:MAG: hypothetical protein COB37_00250 [Kordiimonadales bacterium]